MVVITRLIKKTLTMKTINPQTITILLQDSEERDRAFYGDEYTLLS